VFIPLILEPFANAYSALTHDLLKDVSETNPDLDRLKPAQRPSRPASQPASRHPSPRGLIESRVSFDRPAALPARRPETRSKATDMNPSEKLGVFNATISFIIEEDAPSFSRNAQQTSSSLCVCGRRRIGKWFPVRGTFDTGSNAEFISDDVIARAGLEQLVMTSSEPMEIKMFGIVFSFDKTIRLNWQMDDREMSHTQDFWVATDTREFDLIVGKQWMNDHGYNIAETITPKYSFFGFLRIARKPKGESAWRMYLNKVMV
jgi:hypothetical protein